MHGWAHSRAEYVASGIPGLGLAAADRAGAAARPPRPYSAADRLDSSSSSSSEWVDLPEVRAPSALDL